MTKKSTKTKPQTEATPVVEQEASTSAVGGFDTTPVVVGPKFNPHVRPVATEQPNTTPIPLRQSYESIQETAKGPGVAEWREADRARAELSGLYNSLREDSRYTEEYKSERAWQEYEKTKAKIEELAPAAREKMLRSAETLERLSIPVPEQQGLITKDTDKLLLTAHERSRIEGLIARSEKAAEKGPFRANPLDILAREYERGLHEGGPGGGATVRAAIQLARDWGLDINAIVDAHRKPHHHGALEDAQTALMRANMVGTTVPEPPFKKVGGPGGPHKNVGTRSGAPRAFMPHQPKQTIFEQRKPYWK